MARSSMAAFVAHDGAGPRLGVFYEGQSQPLVGATPATSPSMAVSVLGIAFCGQKATAEGVYVARNTGVIYVDIAAAPASNSRIDVVYAMQRDLHSTTSPDGLTQGEIGVITGTAAVSPTKPAIPAGAVEIGTVQVAAGVTATSNAGCTITTTCQWTTGAGSPIPVRNQTERDALTAFDGLSVYRLDLHATDVYSNGSWGWQTYTPTLTAATTNPTLGTGGAALGRYQIDDHTVTVSGVIHFGTGASFGAGAYSISLPVPSHDVSTGIAGQVVVLPATGGFWGMGWATSSGTGFLIYISGSATGAGTAALTGTTTPIGAAWGAGAEIRFNLTYEAA
jgi:hypothetical protein